MGKSLKIFLKDALFVVIRSLKMFSQLHETLVNNKCVPSSGSPWKIFLQKILAGIFLLLMYSRSLAGSP